MAENSEFIRELVAHSGGMAQNVEKAMDDVYTRRGKHEVFSYAKEEHEHLENTAEVTKLNERIANNIQEWRTSAKEVVAELGKARFMLVEPDRMKHYLEQRAQGMDIEVDLAVEDEITRLTKLRWDEKSLLEAAKEELAAKEALVAEEEALRGYEAYVAALEAVQSITPQGVASKHAVQMTREEIDAFIAAKTQLAQTHEELQSMPGYESLTKTMVPIDASTAEPFLDKLKELPAEKRE